MASSTSYHTLEANSIKYMLGYVAEYELIKAKKHPEYKYARYFFVAKGICFQNFYKFYKRYINSGRDVKALLPTRSGPKPKYTEMPTSDEDVVKKILDYRSSGHNKYTIAEALKREPQIDKACSASTIYRIFAKYGVSSLSCAVKEEKRKIERTFAGSLGHVDCHYLPQSIIQSEPQKRYFVLGCIDDYARIVWVEVLNSTKSIDATFAMMDIILAMHQVYGIKFEEILTDNGSEFCGSQTTLDTHPFERLLTHFSIKHRRTKPYRPQTNGKIERFWRSFHEEVIDGAVFNNLEELKEAILGYNFYYNEKRPHQGLNGKVPLDYLKEKGKKKNHC